MGVEPIPMSAEIMIFHYSCSMILDDYGIGELGGDSVPPIGGKIIYSCSAIFDD
jgi:hypothetical protein